MFYKKNVDICNAKQMFNFLKGHYKYDTMNSWNGLKSIANNVKAYNLGLEGDWGTALQYLEEDEYFTINMMIEDWEAEHKGYEVIFNGRSGGYLVLTSRHSNGNILPDIIADNDYEGFKEDCKYYYGGVKYYLPELREYTKLVQDFDKLCDQLRDYCNELSKRNFAEDKVVSVLDDFIWSYRDDMNYDGVEYPVLLDITKELINIKIDSEMRKFRALIHCFFEAVRTNHWQTIDDGSEIIKLKIC